MAISSLSVTASAQVLKVGGAGTLGTPYATMGAAGEWEVYLKHNKFDDAPGTLEAVVGTNLANNPTQAVFAHQYLGGAPIGGATGQLAISPVVPVTYDSGFQNTNLFYVKQLLSDTSEMWGPADTSGDANGHLSVDVRIGLVEDPAGLVTAGNLPTPGKQMDPSENPGTRGIFFHAVLAPSPSQTYGQPGGNWVTRLTTNEIAYMKPGEKAVALPCVGAITTTYINSGRSLSSDINGADIGVPYDSAIEVSSRMFPHPSKAGWVIAEFKFGNAVAQFLFDPADANFGGTPFAWTKAKPFIYTGHGGWGHTAGALHVGIFTPGDANADGKVDATDLAALAGNWQGSDKAYATGDFSQDGIIDQADLAIIASNWPATAATPFSQAVKAFPSLPAAPTNVAAAKAKDDKHVRVDTPQPVAVVMPPVAANRQANPQPGAGNVQILTSGATPRKKDSGPNVKMVWMIAGGAGLVVVAGMYIPAWRRKRRERSE